MYKAYSNKEARDIDRKAISAGIRVRELMESAGAALADVVQAAMEEKNIDDVLVVVGTGNNAGDGFVAARLLMERGKDVQVLCLSEKLSGECARVRLRFRGEVMSRMPRRQYAMIVDCIFGTGLTRAPEGDAAALISMINSSGAYVVSCDIPSGLQENGVAYTPCVRANETVAMGFAKSALLMGDGVDMAGKVHVADIGLNKPEAELDYSEMGVDVWEDSDVKVFYPARRSHVNKGTFGKAYILSGGARMGAALLAANASLRSGVGYTVMRVPQQFVTAAATALPSCVVEEFESVDDDILSANAIAIGMGAGVSQGLYSLVCTLLSEYDGTLILDADALTALAMYGLAPLKEKNCDVILTPHPREFSALTGESVKDILENAIPYAKRFAEKYGVTLILKNNRSVITDGERVAINPTGSPALAKCGSGDVLTGILAGTAARSIPPFEAACVASYLLGRAGEISQGETGQYSTTASDVANNLSKAIQILSQEKR